MPKPEPTGKQLRAARLANALASAYRAGEVDAADALRVIRHELRRVNTNKKHLIVRRSRRAQEVIDKAGGHLNVPKNGSPDALHADHVWSVQEEDLKTRRSVKAWLKTLEQISEVVCVTAAENYKLQRFERQGLWGPEKYQAAEIAFVDVEPTA